MPEGGAQNDRNKGSEHSKLERRRRVLTTEMERLSYAIANSRRKPDELLKRIDECDPSGKALKSACGCWALAAKMSLASITRNSVTDTVRRLEDWSPRSRPIRRRSKLA